MSIRCTKAVLNYPLDDCAFKAVLFALGDYANDADEAWPCIANLCAKSGCGRSTVKRKLRLAEDLGVIRVSIRADMTSLYSFRREFLKKHGDNSAEDPVLFAQSTKQVNPEPSLFDRMRVAQGGAVHSEPRSAPVTPRSAPVTPRSAVDPNPSEEPSEEPSDSLVAADASTTVESLPDYVIRRWNEIASCYPTMAKTRPLEPGQRKRIVDRARGSKAENETELQVWEEVFDAIDRSPFLKGLAPPGPGRDKAFRPSLIWILKQENFAKVVNGVYDGKHDRNGQSIEGSRRVGPTAQALANVKARFSSGTAQQS